MADGKAAELPEEREEIARRKQAGVKQDASGPPELDPDTPAEAEAEREAQPPDTRGKKGVH